MFNQNKDALFDCILSYEHFFEDSRKGAGDCKTINNYFCELPEGSHQILEINDLEKLQKSESIKFETKLKMLQDFA